MAELFSNFGEITWQMVVMWLIGALLIYLAIKKDMEPALLLPMGFGAILVNIPFSGAVGPDGALSILFDAGIANELFPLILFIGIGAMIDFGPLLSNPKMMLFGAAAQFGIFITFSLSRLFGFALEDAAATAIIGAADGPTSIFVAQLLQFFLHRRHHRGRLFVYGARPHRAACGHPLHHHEKGAAHQDGVQARFDFQNHAHSASRFSSRLSPVWSRPSRWLSSAF